MLCFRYKKLLMPYVENALDDLTRSRVSRHIARCKRCADDLHALEMMSKALKHVDVPSAEPAADLWAKVSARIADESISPAASRRSWVLQIAAVGTVVVLIITGYTMMRPASHVEHIYSFPSPRAIAKIPAAKQPEMIAKLAKPITEEHAHKLPAKAHRQKPIMMAKLPPEEINSGIKSKIAEKYSADIKMEGASSTSSRMAPSMQKSENIESAPGSKDVRVCEAAPSAAFDLAGSSYKCKDDAEIIAPASAPMASKAPSGVCYDSAAKSAPINRVSEQDQISEYERTGNYAAMLEAVQKLLKTDPNNAYYLLKLGEVYEHCGKTQEARATYEKVASGSDLKYASIAKSRLADMKK